MPAALWRVRKEDAHDQGHAIALERLVQGIEDGTWLETDLACGPNERQWQRIGDHEQLSDFVPRQRWFNSKPSEEAEMDMTPMIDVTFQLLIFFMIAATYVVQKTLDMPRPGPKNEGAGTVTIDQLKEDNLMIVVDRERNVTLQGTAVALADLPDQLIRAAKEHDSVELVLDVDDEVDQETVVRVVDAAGAAQIEKVHFVSRVGPNK